MSGPKKADVEAQLNIARDSQRKCANLISRAEDVAIARLLKDAKALLRQVDAEGKTLQRELDMLTGEIRRVAPESVQTIVHSAAEFRRGLAEANATMSRVNELILRTQQAERGAEQIFNHAEKEYQRAMNALETSGEHNLHQEMGWAKQAVALFDQAAAALTAAGQVRKEAQQSATSALRHANELQAMVTATEKQVRSTRVEAQARLRAEEEARRIVEQKRRNATVAVEKARSTVGRLADVPHQKFCPGQGGAIQKEFESALRLLNGNRFDEAVTTAERVQQDALRLEQEVSAAHRMFELERTEAETQLGVLRAEIEGAGPDLIREWSNTPGALADAHNALTKGEQSVTGEHFVDASTSSQAAKRALTEAFRSAAENKSAHEKREKIGDAIIGALDDLGFEVSFERGSRTEPLRISGQTRDMSGKGDFDIAIPLDGKVDFEIDTPEGDTACIATVGALQNRLASQGIAWNITDWGNAQGATLLIEPIPHEPISIGPVPIGPVKRGR